MDYIKNLILIRFHILILFKNLYLEFSLLCLTFFCQKFYSYFTHMEKVFLLRRLIQQDFRVPMQVIIIPIEQGSLEKAS
jgi:hypothetical protein